MARNIDDLIAELPGDHQQEIEERFQEMNAEYMALQELRKAMKFTQKDIAKKLKMDQGNISKLESRTDLMLSTLRRYIESMGGSLKLIAEFPQKSPVEVIGFENAAVKKNI